MTILLCYDGSPDAVRAIDVAGDLFDGREAIVLTIWEGFSEVLTRAGAGLAAAPLNFEEIDASNRSSANEQAQEGARRARSAGLDAHARVAESGTTIWETVLDQAEATGAEAIVLGSRGLTGVKSMLLGSVSHAVLQHADRPVVVVPCSQAAGKRAERRHRHHEAARAPAHAG
ncbi:MAG: universal stress protein [Solirubrobacteraceae bacterium]|jgi:nucleotide-binding universal stress UspA family protein